MYQFKIIQKLYLSLIAVTILMATATVLSILQVSNPISGGDIQTNVQVNVPTPTPTSGVAGTSIERAQNASSQPANDQPLAAKTLSTSTEHAQAIAPTSNLSLSPTSTPKPVVTPTHVTASPIACALGPTPLPHSNLFCKDIR